MIINELRSKAIKAEYRVIDIESGIGIEFSDGNDVFWMIPGDIVSTIDPRDQTAQNASAIFDEFLRIGSVRRDVVKVIRNHCRKTKCEIEKDKSGLWYLERSGAICTIDVGMVLTNRICRGESVYEIINSLYFHGRTPSRARIDRYLSGRDATEVTNPKPAAAPKTCGIRSVVAMISGFRAIRLAGEHASDFGDDPNSMVARIQSRQKGAIFDTLNKLAELLPNVEAFMECGGRSIELKFEDSQSSHSIDYLGSEFCDLVRQLGSNGAAQKLAEEYSSVNDLRRRVIFTIETIANKRGWRREERHAIFSANEAKWYYGDHFVSVKFLPGDDLTDAIEQLPLEQVFPRVLSGDDGFVDECIQALSQSDGVQEFRVESTRLAPSLPKNTPELIRLDDDVIRRMDEFAQSHKEAFFSDRYSLGKYRDRLYWNGPNDTWACLGDWMKLSEAGLAPDFFTAQSVLIYSDARHPSTDELAHRYLEDCQIHGDLGEDEIEVIWKYRHEFPELARECFSPVEYVDDSVMGARARFGDPIALQYWYEKYAESIEDGTYWDDNRVVSIYPARSSKVLRDRFHSDAIGWASSTWRWSPPETDKIRMALDLGFDDVCPLLENNPYIVHGLLRGDRRHSQYDEPGILCAGSFLLSWSILQPTRFLAALLATAVLTDFLGTAFAYYQRAMENGELTNYEREVAETSIRRNWDDMQLELAIAWLRCRSRLFVSLV